MVVPGRAVIGLPWVLASLIAASHKQRGCGPPPRRGTGPVSFFGLAGLLALITVARLGYTAAEWGECEAA